MEAVMHVNLCLSPGYHLKIESDSRMSQIAN